jgi:hypothetical protein
MAKKKGKEFKIKFLNMKLFQIIYLFSYPNIKSCFNFK